MNEKTTATKFVGEWSHEPKKIKEKFAGLATRVKKIMDLEAEYEVAIDNGAAIDVRISNGNKKMGDIPSVSLPPVATCPNCKGCAQQCYYIRNCCMYPAVLEAVAKNLAAWKKNPREYFQAIASHVNSKKLDAFRWHVGGDIPNREYLEGMVDVANACPNCKFLVFTKNYSSVNAFLGVGGVFPKNMQVIFSAWPGVKMDNPYELPTSTPIFESGLCAETEGKLNVKCPGNCRKCFESNSGCWGLKKNQSVVFPAH